MAGQLNRIIIYREIYMNVLLPLMIVIGSIYDNRNNYQFGKILVVWGPTTLLAILINYLNWSFWAEGKFILEPDYKTASMSFLLVLINFGVLYLSEFGFVLLSKLLKRQLTSV